MRNVAAPAAGAVKSGACGRCSGAALSQPPFIIAAASFPMETREEFLTRLAAVLDGLGMEHGLKIKERSVERAFGGTGAIAIAEAEAFARAHGYTFRYNRAMREGMFFRSYPPGGRA